MDEKEQNPPSQAEANKVLRVIKGEKQKYTVQIFMKDGKVWEYQSENKPKPEWNTEARALWVSDGYDNSVCPMADVEFIHTEENPK